MIGLRQGIQTGFKNNEMRVWGCYFFTLVQMACLRRRITYSDDGLIELFNHCKQVGWIGNNSFINNAVAIVNYCLGENTIRDITRGQEIPDAAEHIIVHMQKPTVQHFAICNTKGEITWDSWTPSAAGQNFPVLNYRVLV